MCTVAHHDLDAMPGDQPTERQKRPGNPERIAQACARELHQLGADCAQSGRQIALPKSKADNQTAPPELLAAGEQIEKSRLRATDFGRRLDEQEITSVGGEIWTTHRGRIVVYLTEVCQIGGGPRLAASPI